MAEASKQRVSGPGSCSSFWSNPSKTLHRYTILLSDPQQANKQVVGRMTTRRTSAAIYCVVTLVACCFLPAARGFHLSSPSLLPAAAKQQLKAGSSARTAQFTPASFAARSLQGTLRKQRTGGRSIFLGGLNAVLSDKKDTKQAPGAPPKTVLVVGGGLGGVSVTYDVKHRMRSQDKVILLSDRSTFDFTPSNPWVAVRFRKPKVSQRGKVCSCVCMRVCASGRLSVCACV